MLGGGGSGKGRMSTVLSFGGNVDTSLLSAGKRARREIDRTKSTLGKLETAQRKVRREMRKAPKGEEYDRLSKRYETLGRRIDSVRRSTERLHASEKLSARMRALSTSALDTATRVTTRGILALGAASAATVGGVLSLTHGVAASADELSQMSTRMGVSQRALVGLGYAASQAGANTEELAGGMQRLDEKVAEALRDRRGGAATMLQRLGLDPQSLARMSPDERLGRLADALQGVQNQALRTRAATEILGGAGTRLLPMLAGGSAGLAAMTEEAEALGGVMSDELKESAGEYNAALGRLGITAQGVKYRLAGTVMPALTGFLGSLQEDIASGRLDVDGIINDLGGGVSQLLDATREHLPAILDLIPQATRLFASLIPIVKSAGETFFGIIDAVGGTENAVGILKNVFLGFAAVAGGRKIVGAVQLFRDLGGLFRDARGLAGGARVLGGIGTGLRGISTAAATAKTGLLGLAPAILPIIASVGALIGALGLAYGISEALNRDKAADAEADRRQQLSESIRRRLDDGDLGDETRQMIAEERALRSGDHDASQFIERPEPRSFVPAGIEEAPAEAVAAVQRVQHNDNRRQTININGAQNPEEIRRQVEDFLNRDYGDAAAGAYEGEP